jgi:hypothetical protein
MDQEIKSEVRELVATTLLTMPIHVWIVKRAVAHLTGTDPGWRGAYAIASGFQVAGYWFSSGAQQRQELSDKAKTLNYKIEVQKSRGQK